MDAQVVMAGIRVSISPEEVAFFIQNLKIPVKKNSKNNKLKTFVEFERGELFGVLFSPPALLAMFRSSCRGFGGGVSCGANDFGDGKRCLTFNAITGRTTVGLRANGATGVRGNGCNCNSSASMSMWFTPITLSLIRSAVACWRLLTGRAVVAPFAPSPWAGKGAGGTGAFDAHGPDTAGVSSFIVTSAIAEVVLCKSSWALRRRGWYRDSSTHVFCKTHSLIQSGVTVLTKSEWLCAALYFA